MRRRPAAATRRAAHCVNAQSHSPRVVIMHSSQEDSLCPPPHYFCHRKTSQGYTSVCLQGGQSLVSALLGSCKDGDRSCPLPHTCGVLLGHSPPRLAALVLPASSFTAAFHLSLHTEKGRSPPGRALRMPSPSPTSQACSPRALRHQPRLNKTQSTASKKAFSVSPTRHYILHSRPASKAHASLSQHKYTEFLFNRTVTHF